MEKFPIDWNSEMKTKNPLESTDVQELINVGMYWMNKSYSLFCERNTMEAFLNDNDINPSMDEFLAKMNAIQNRQRKKWEETQKSINSIDEKKGDICLT